MDILLVVLLVVLIFLVALAITRLTRPTQQAALPAPPVDISQQVSIAVQSALGTAIQNLSDKSRSDLEASIRMAVDRATEASSNALGERTQAIDSTLRGVQSDIARRMSEMDTELRQLRELNVQKFESVDNAVAALAKQAGTLNTVLSSTQARGQWGERMAEDLLRAAGLIEGINYEKQDTITGGGRPDYTFLMPPDRVLYMDVKFPMDSYTRYVNSADDQARKMLKEEFLKAVRDRVRELEKRDYVVSTSKHSLDYVLLFVPNESITGFVHESDPELIDWALSRKVVLCSPLTLYAFLVVVRQATESFRTEETASQIMQLLSKFRKQWEMYVKSLEKVKRSFETMQGELDDLTTGKRFKGLNRETKKIDDLRKSHGIPELEEVTEADADEDEATD